MRAALRLLALVSCASALAPPRFACAPEDRPTDCAALGELYGETGGSGWRTSAGWKAAASDIPTRICSFARVLCDKESGRPVELQLDANGLNGTLPTSLSVLDSLTSFQAGGNALRGSLPSSLGSLTNLLNLYLGYNQIGATLPSTLSSLTSLTFLGLGFNKELTGTVPASYAALTALQTLYVEGTALCGSLPPALSAYCAAHPSSCDGVPLPPCASGISTAGAWACAGLPVAQCEALGEFYAATGGATSWLRRDGWGVPGVDACSWEGVTCGGEPQEVVGLTLRVNGLLGTLPASLAQLTHLTMLDLLDNRLRGTLPADAFAQLGALQHLNLYNNDMSGPLPDNLGLISSLTYLGLQGSQFSGTLPEAWGAPASRLSSLTSLTVGENRLSGTIPAGWAAGMPSLRTLVLRRNELSGTLPPELGSWAAIESIGLGGNAGLRGTVPASWDALVELGLGLVELGPGTSLCGDLPGALGEACQSGKVNCEGVPLPRCMWG